MRYYLIFLVMLLIGIGSCDTDLTGLQPKRPNPINPAPTPTVSIETTVVPSIPLLIAPENNNTCTTEEPIDDKTSNVTFLWRKSNNTTSYELIVEGAGVDQNFKSSNTINSNTFTMILDRGLPYSWWVISKSSNSEKTAKSAVWTFYLEGKPNESHVPFPASLNFPENNSTVNAENEIEITFQWEGLDLDDDIVSFDFLLGTSKDDLDTIENGISQPQLKLKLETDKVYFWQIYTTDSIGHISKSDIFRLDITSNGIGESDSTPSDDGGTSDTDTPPSDTNVSQTDDIGTTPSDETKKTITIDVLEDIWILGLEGSSKSDLSIGNAKTLVSSTGNKDDDFRRFFLKFSLGDVQASTVTKATLHLTADRDWTKAEDAFGGATTQTVYHVEDDSWTEADLNANSEPDFNPNPITTFTSNSRVGNASDASPPIVHLYDITSVFSKDSDGTISVRITTGDTGGNRITYFSKEGSQSNHPRLVIETNQ